MYSSSRKTRSFIIGCLILVLTGASVLWQVTNSVGEGPLLDRFAILRVFVGLILAGLAFYHARGPQELVIDLIDFEEDMTTFCPHCSTVVGKQDRYCRGCGHLL